MAIKGMRNILIYEYFGVDFRLVWKTIEKDIFPLKNEIINIIDKLEQELF